MEMISGAIFLKYNCKKSSQGYKNPIRDLCYGDLNKSLCVVVVVCVGCYFRTHRTNLGAQLQAPNFVLTFKHTAFGAPLQ
jgi:hypothetical protein